MKNLRRAIISLFVAALFLTPMLGFSQDAQSTQQVSILDRILVEVGVGVGAIPGFSDSTGIVLPVTASYMPFDLKLGGMDGFVSVGARWEPGLVVGSDAASGSFALQFMESFSAAGDFYLRLSKKLDFVPFAGLSLGLYQVAGAGGSVTTGNTGEASGNFFGVAPRIGIRYKGINAYLSYNIIAKGNASMNPSYISLVAGYTFGGGRLSK